MKRYVITGGPGSGKSCVILELELRKEWVTREAAEDYIKLRQAHRIPKPWEEKDFQQKILDLSIQRESRVPRNIERVFHDRSVIDGLAYEPEGTDIYTNILRAATQREKRLDNLNSYDGIFMVELLGEFETTITRREDRKKALELQSKFDKAYRGLGYSPIYVPAGSLDERVGFILKNV